MKNAVLVKTTGIGLAGAVFGSCSLMLLATSQVTTADAMSLRPLTDAAAPDRAMSDQDRIVDAVKRVRPSVVSLLVTVNGTQIVPNDAFSESPDDQQGGGTRRRFNARASGSGFVYTKSGLILTNAHVVPKGTSSIVVVFANGDHVPGKVYSSDPAVDIALVKVDNYAKLPPPVQFSDSSKLNAGQWAIAIGEPFELKDSVSVGVVSGFDRDEPIQDENGNAHLFRGMLQTSAPINPGNSGGPLIDDRGQVIGINQSTANPRGGAQGIGFAIPSNLVADTAVKLAKNEGKTLDANTTGTGVAYLGVGLEALNAELRAEISYPRSAGTGAVITAIPPNGPAAKADLSPGDVIQKIEGKDVKTPDDVVAAVKALKPGEMTRLLVWSAGTRKLIVVALGEQPAEVFMQQQRM